MKFDKLVKLTLESNDGSFSGSHNNSMKNKKYLMVDRYNGAATYITLKEGETIEMVAQGMGMEVQKGDVRSWTGVSYIIIELPA